MSMAREVVTNWYSERDGEWKRSDGQRACQDHGEPATDCKFCRTSKARNTQRKDA